LFGVEIIVDEEVSGAADDDGCGEEARVTGIGLRGEEAVSFLEIKRFEIFVIFLRKPDI